MEDHVLLQADNAAVQYEKSVFRSFLSSVHTEREDDCEQDADPACDEAGVHNGDNTDLNGLCLSFRKTKSYRDEVAGSVAVQCEQTNQCQGRGDPSGCDLGTHDTAQDLGDNSAGAQDCGQAGDGADDTQDKESGNGTEQGLQDAGEEGAEARAVDDTDQHGDEGHEGEQGVDGSLDSVTCSLVEGRDDLACAQANLCQGVAIAGLGHLLGQLLGGVDAALFLLCGCFCCGSSIERPLCRDFRTISGHYVGICYAGDIDVFLDELGKGACLADGVDVDGGDAFLGIEAAAECAAAVDDDERELIFGGAGLEAVDGLEACQFHDPGKDLGGDTAAGDVHDFISLVCSLDGQGAAEAAGAFFYADCSVFCHLIFLPL